MYFFLGVKSCQKVAEQLVASPICTGNKPCLNMLELFRLVRRARRETKPQEKNGRAKAKEGLLVLYHRPDK